MRGKVFASNRKAYHDYHILESLEAGIALTGTEVKSVRAGLVSLREAYARIERGEAWLLGAHIAAYAAGNRYNHEPGRDRKLLLHRWEISRLGGKLREGGMTLVPLKMYDTKGHVKIEIGLAKGKKQYDKRQAIAERDARRVMDRAIKRSLDGDR